jgi:hypothetical protein
MDTTDRVHSQGNSPQGGGLFATAHPPHPEPRAGIQALPVETGSPIPSEMSGWRDRHAPGRSLACRRWSRPGRQLRLPRSTRRQNTLGIPWRERIRQRAEAVRTQRNREPSAVEDTWRQISMTVPFPSL